MEIVTDVGADDPIVLQPSEVEDGHAQSPAASATRLSEGRRLWL